MPFITNLASNPAYLNLKGGMALCFMPNQPMAVDKEEIVLIARAKAKGMLIRKTRKSALATLARLKNNETEAEPEGQ